MFQIYLIIIFIHKGKYEYVPLLISLDLYSLLFDFKINTLFFSDVKYKNGGE